MFNIGDYFEVTETGHLGRIISISDDKVWIEWEFFKGTKYDYKKHEAFPKWGKTNKTFKGLVPVHPSGIMLSNKVQVNDQLLDFFESLLDDCKHDFESYQGLNEAFDFCKHCNQKAPYKHLSKKKA